MYKAIVLFFLSFTLLAAALPTEPASQCNTGPVQCCNSVSSSSDPVTSLVLALLGVVVQGINVPIGLTCNPITVIGAGANSCTAQTVCCSNNSFNGLIAVGCTPININL
ncbi:hydrophobin [Moniliophthora roreri MCA 2997]|uniref:Hydrophobin n=2 Tax=Moniliophthora roreri TaxID=221103 RepID=V2YKM0_MONRO|nr:hydrophobin [Moniliophthora roreri MCA 2997]KAI3615738.1 hydrophobin [Moniliophthora roreri]